MGSALVGSNYTDELRAAGLRTPGELLKLWDINGGVGGPIKKDRVWYFVNSREEGSWQSVPGMYREPERRRPDEVHLRARPHEAGRHGE